MIGGGGGGGGEQPDTSRECSGASLPLTTAVPLAASLAMAEWHLQQHQQQQATT